ncbi:MAG: flagellar biosynthetic protein FliO [Eubacteriales bacterium]
MPPDIFDLVIPIFAVILVILAAWLFTKYYGKRQLRVSQGRNITIVERISTGKDSSLMIVKTCGRVFLISISGQQSSLISELDPETLLADTHTGAGGEFFNTLTTALKNITKPGGEKDK